MRTDTMKAIEATGTVTEDGKLIVDLPTGVAPGEHKVIIVIEIQGERNGTAPLGELPLHDFGPWPEDLSLRREDIYDDWGR
jgi:hypothetical protein